METYFNNLIQICKHFKIWDETQNLFTKLFKRILPLSQSPKDTLIIMCTCLWLSIKFFECYYMTAEDITRYCFRKKDIDQKFLAKFKHEMIKYEIKILNYLNYDLLKILN